MLIEHIGRQLTHGTDRPGTPFRDNVQALVDHYGSGRAAARALQVPESTLRGWRKGIIPKDVARIRALGISARVMRVDPDLLQGAMSGEPDFELTVRGTIQVSDDVRSRTIYPGRTMPIQDVRTALREWLHGDDDTAERTLLKSIRSWYAPLDFHSVEWAGFGSAPRQL